MSGDTPADWRAASQRRAIAASLVRYEVQQGNEPDAGLLAIANTGKETP